MTCIAWDGVILAADRMAENGYARRPVTKIWTLEPERPVVLAIAGNHAASLLLKDWWVNGADVETWPKEQSDNDKRGTLIVVKNGECSFYEGLPVALTLDHHPRFWAWGSGSEIAIGAMAMGADAIRAVELANEFAVGCGLGVDHFIPMVRKPD